MQYMIVHSEGGLWQERKAENADLGGNSKDGIGAKGLYGRQEESEEAGTRNKHWRGGILVSRGGNGAGSLGQRPLGGIEYRRSKAFPQIGQRNVSFGKVGDGGGSSAGRGEWVSVSRSNRRAARSRR
jgi:hypothetical protein